MQKNRGYWLRSRAVAKRQLSIQPKILARTFLGSFLGIGAIGVLSNIAITAADQLFLIGSFGASAVLLFAAQQSPLAQPRNLVIGHGISACVGVTVWQLLPEPQWLSAALAVSLAIMAMQLTRSLHPPGGATALIAVIGSDKIKSLGYSYVLSPVLTGVVVLFTITCILATTTKWQASSAYALPSIWLRLKRTWRQTE